MITNKVHTMPRLQRTYLPLLFLSVLGGCAAQDAKLPTSLVKGAVDGMWTSRSSDAVKSCIEASTGTTDHPLFQVVANDPETSVYTTTVNILPAATHVDRENAVKCL
jgi:hypothetical protein